MDKEAPCGLVVIEEEAEVVRRVFHLFVDEGYSIREISKTLTREGIPTSRGKQRWPKTSIQRMLQNTAYAGYVYYNKWKRKSRQLRLRDRSEWIHIPVTSIIDEGLFQQAQSPRASTAWCSPEIAKATTATACPSRSRSGSRRTVSSGRRSRRWA